jgi:molybdopterin-guanine dinucleotide biosynthesis protein A
VVLAGGRSQRLGADKTRLSLVREGEVLSLVEWAVRRLRRCCDAVYIAGPEELGHLAPTLADADAPGPAGGLLGARAVLPGVALFALACDLPWLGGHELLRLRTGWDATATDMALFRSPSGLEPLCSIWSPAALARLAARCAEGDASLWSLAEDDQISSLVLDAGGPSDEAFFNLNRPQDLERFLARESRHTDPADADADGDSGDRGTPRGHR